MPTLGVDFRFKKLYHNNKIIKLQIWDTAGQERYRSLCNLYYKGADFIVLIFDLSDRESFENIKKAWLDELGVYCDPNKVSLLVLGLFH